ncbi:MAG: protein kinase, partial [Proteobacteria bacterium]|nr:protein kinase [Pseudomonadota bacterium]
MELKHLKELGAGGFGRVDLVETPDGNRWARKTFSVSGNLPPQLVDNVRRRFAREARTQSGIQHRNIVPVDPVGLNDDPPWYLMPVAESTLHDDLAKDRTLGGNYLAAVADIVAALDEMHAMHLYHRDLKPQNVLRFPDD